MTLKNLDKIELQFDVRTGIFYYIDGNGQFAEFTVPQSVQLGYRSYTALISQSGTSAPTAVVLNNSLLGEPSFTRRVAGSYQLVLTGQFNASKTWVIINTSLAGSDFNYLYSASRLNSNEIEINSYNVAGNPEDDLMENVPIEIRIYN